MKYAIVIPEGAADEPLDDLDGATPLAAAAMPHLDDLARRGHVGTVATTPPSMACTDDVTLMSLLGFDPRAAACGPAAIEAVGAGVELPTGGSVLRLSLVTVQDGIMIDQTAGRLGSPEGRTLLAELGEALRRELGADAAGLRLVATSGHRGLLVDETPRTYDALTTSAPPLIVGGSIRRHLPAGEHGQLMRSIVELSGAIFAEHEVNRTRRELGELPATHAWPWGAGAPIELPSFASRFGGQRGLMICCRHLPAGLAAMIGFDVEYLDEADFPRSAGRRMVDAIEGCDVVCLHDPSPDRAAHEQDVNGKVDALAALDEHIIAPLAQRLETSGAWRLLVAPSHATSARMGRHDAAPAPMLLAGDRIDAVLSRPYDEASALDSDLHVAVGSELMEYFLFGSRIRRRHE